MMRLATGRCFNTPEGHSSPHCRWPLSLTLPSLDGHCK